MSRAQETFYLRQENALDNSNDWKLGASESGRLVSSEPVFTEEDLVSSSPDHFSAENSFSGAATFSGTATFSGAATALEEGSLPPVEHRSLQKSSLSTGLNQLVRLIANVTEAYTAAIFIADNQEKLLRLVAAHTLSRDLLADATIGFGCGLVGWTAENAVRISVCPFEHDASTLLYYRSDQALKSFIAVPIIDAANMLRGVIAVDSKKSYAFAKVTEKILLDCAAQAATFIDLNNRLSQSTQTNREVNSDTLTTFIESLRKQESEKDLLQLAAELPLELVDRDALVVITMDEPGSSSAAFYSTKNQARVGHRLLEVVCRHKKILCRERSVHAVSADDAQQRSFLSIPFRVLKREAGSINLLSRPFEAFSALEISALERISEVLGNELEHVRLRERLVSREESSGLLSWEVFSLQAKKRLAEAARSKRMLSLLRMNISNIHEIESFLGVDAVQQVLVKFMRLLEQVKGGDTLASYLYGTEILILSERGEAERIMGRFLRLLDKISLDHSAGVSANLSKNPGRQLGVKVGELLSKGLQHVVVQSAKEGDALEDLLARSRHSLEIALTSKPLEVMANAGNWK